MKTSNLRLSRPIYLVLIVILTELILVIGALLILLPTGFLHELPLGIFGFLLLFKTIITTIAVIIAAGTQPQQPRVLLSRGVGLVLGHVIGLLLGGILGGRYGGPFWAIVGIVGGYLLAGRVGARISYAVSMQLERLSPSEEIAG